MANIVVKANERADRGKNASRRLRARGMIPSVIYGRSIEPTPVVVDPGEILGILHSDAGRNTIFKLEIGSLTKDVIIRDYQLDPIRDQLLHADFQAVSMDEKMEFEVPIDVTGSAKGAKEGGVLEQVLREITVECLPGDVPDSILLDVSGLDIGDTVHVSDLKIDTSKIEVITGLERLVITMVPPMAEEEEPEIEEEEVAEPEVIKKGKEPSEKDESAGAEGKEKEKEKGRG